MLTFANMVLKSIEMIGIEEEKEAPIKDLEIKREALAH